MGLLKFLRVPTSGQSQKSKGFLYYDCGWGGELKDCIVHHTLYFFQITKFWTLHAFALWRRSNCDVSVLRIDDGSDDIS